MKFYEIPDYPNYKLDIEGNLWSNLIKGSKLRREGKFSRINPYFRKLGDSNSCPYPIVSLYSCYKKKRTLFLHCLVAEIFHGPRPLLSEVSHLDGDPLNFNPANLKWATRSENQGKHGIIIGEIRKDNKSGKRGVYYDKSRKSWRAYLKIEGKCFSCRTKTKEEALRIRRQLEKEYLFKQDDII